MKNTDLFFLAVIGLIFLSGFTYTAIPNPEELGKVRWIRNYEKALTLSEEQDKPILILFQEVPGCGTCKGFGNNVLSHPLIVDAIEHEFIPLAIYNNRKGKDLEVLKRFGEPAWNNPVVRIINRDQRALTSRLARYNALELVDGMIAALENYKADIPAYLYFLQMDLTAQQKEMEEATFGMYCFWSGESKLGSIEGVVASRPGFMNGGEVVQLQFDPTVISYEELTRQAKSIGAFDRIMVKDKTQEKIAKQFVSNTSIQPSGKFRSDKEPQYYLSKSIYRYLPMLPVQATKVNSAIANGHSPELLLSPTQNRFLKDIKAHPKKKRKVLYQSKYFKAAWEGFIGVRDEE